MSTVALTVMDVREDLWRGRREGRKTGRKGEKGRVTRRMEAGGGRKKQTV